MCSQSETSLQYTYPISIHPIGLATQRRVYNTSTYLFPPHRSSYSETSLQYIYPISIHPIRLATQRRVYNTSTSSLSTQNLYPIRDKFTIHLPHLFPPHTSSYSETSSQYIYLISIYPKPLSNQRRVYNTSTLGHLYLP